MSVVEIIALVAGILTPIGGGIAFVWNKIESRFSKIEVELAKCEQRDRQGAERRAVLHTVIELLWRELEEIGPSSSKVLARAKRLLDGLKRPDDEPEAP